MEEARSVSTNEAAEVSWRLSNLVTGHKANHYPMTKKAYGNQIDDEMSSALNPLKTLNSSELN